MGPHDLANWLNEARGGVTRWFWNEITSNPQEPWGLPASTIDTLGSVALQQLGAPGPSIFNQTTYNFRDTASTVLGRHSVKMGVDIYKEQDNDNAAWSARPSFSFRNLWDFANTRLSESGDFDRGPDPRQARLSTFGLPFTHFSSRTISE